MEHGSGTSTPTPPPDMPRFESPTPWGAPPDAPPPGWVEPPLTGEPGGRSTTLPMNAWSEWSIGLAALAVFGLVLGLLVLPRSFGVAMDGSPDHSHPLAVLSYTAAWVMGFGLLGLMLAGVGAWQAHQRDPDGPLSEGAVIPLLVSTLPLVLLVAFLAALVS